MLFAAGDGDDVRPGGKLVCHSPQKTTGSHRAILTQAHRAGIAAGNCLYVRPRRQLPKMTTGFSRADDRSVRAQSDKMSAAAGDG